MTIQKQIDDIGFNLLNSNHIDKHIIFTFKNNSKKSKELVKFQNSKLLFMIMQ